MACVHWGIMVVEGKKMKFVLLSCFLFIRGSDLICGTRSVELVFLVTPRHLIVCFALFRCGTSTITFVEPYGSLCLSRPGLHCSPVTFSYKSGTSFCYQILHLIIFDIRTAVENRRQNDGVRCTRMAWVCVGIVLTARDARNFWAWRYGTPFCT